MRFGKPNYLMPIQDYLVARIIDKFEMRSRQYSLPDAYMSTQREVLEGQTGSHRAKRANFGGGSGGPPPENCENLHCKWCNLRYS